MLHKIPLVFHEESKSVIKIWCPIKKRKYDPVRGRSPKLKIILAVAVEKICVSYILNFFIVLNNNEALKKGRKLDHPLVELDVI